MRIDVVRSVSSIAPGAITPRQAHTAELMRRTGEPLLPGNRVELLKDGRAAFGSMFAAIAHARDHINIESYTIDAGGPGAELARLLVQRCAEGVRVNLLFDSVGSMMTSTEYFGGLRRAGVSLCEYNPVQRWRALLGKTLHLRNHRKLMVIDGRIGFIGGMNISTVYASGSSPLAAVKTAVTSPLEAALSPALAVEAEPSWHDLHLRIEGPVVGRLQQLFTRHWQRHADTPMQSARYFPPLAAVGTQRVSVAACDAGRRANPVYSALLGAIETARSRILLTTAYLVPPRRLLRALTRAAERGVAVELLLPGKSDFWAPLHAGRSHYSALLRAGVRIHEHHDSLLHAKACVIDGVWSSVGSSNTDWRSFVHNAEANVVVIDDEFGAQLEAAFHEDVLRARHVDAERWSRRSTWLRLKESMARRFEYLL